MGFWPPPLARPVRPASSAAPAAVESTVCSHPAPITLPLTYLTPTSVCSLAEALLLVLGGLGGLLLRLLLRCGLAGVLSLLGLSVSEGNVGCWWEGRSTTPSACGTSARAHAKNRGYLALSCAGRVFAQHLLGRFSRSRGLLLLFVITLRHLDAVLPGRNESSATRQCGARLCET